MASDEVAHASFFCVRVSAYKTSLFHWVLIN
jgi:hypothetical protein